MIFLEKTTNSVLIRYSRSPAKQINNIPSAKPHIETKTDYGKYSRNNNNMNLTPTHHQAPPEYSRASHQDLRDSQLSIHHSPLRNPGVNMNGFVHK